MSMEYYHNCLSLVCIYVQWALEVFIYFLQRQINDSPGRERVYIFGLTLTYMDDGGNHDWNCFSRETFISFLIFFESLFFSTKMYHDIYIYQILAYLKHCIDYNPTSNWKKNKQCIHPRFWRLTQVQSKFIDRNTFVGVFFLISWSQKFIIESRVRWT